MKILFMTNEYPPYVYGGAGVHVENLSRELSSLCQVEVRCFGDQEVKQQNFSVKGFQNCDASYTTPQPLHRVFDAIQRCLNFNTENIDADIVHAHTWYTHLGAVLAKINYSVPMVITVHSLEPLRPWKKEQLGQGYEFSLWVERTALEMADAIIAVSQNTKENILRLINVDEEKIHVIHNGIDPNLYKASPDSELLTPLGIDTKKPFVLFLGRITRQKGILHLVNSIPYLDKDLQVVLCASSPDTPEIAKEMEAQILEDKKKHPQLVWINESVDEKIKITLYSHAALFCCPSMYEPFGIINLEAMACETPVVATAIGGIPEVVLDGETGNLVPVELKNSNSFEPKNADSFHKDIAQRINCLMKDEALRIKMGQAGRKRVVEHFAWNKIAEQTHALYKKILSQK